MLPIVIGAVAALLIGSCKTKEEKPEPFRPAFDGSSSTSPPSPTVLYERQCLVQEDCDFEIQKAAIYDYVGAVYDESGMVSYDQALTGIERTRVEKEFGVLTDRNRALDFVALARSKFLQQRWFQATGSPYRQAMRHCTDASVSWSWNALTREHPTYGSAAILSGVHMCGDQWGELYLKDGLEFQVAAHPEDWMFYLEGAAEDKDARFNESSGEVQAEEVGLFRRIANVLSIPVQDPILAIYSEPVMAHLEKAGITRMEMAVWLYFGKALMVWGDLGYTNEEMHQTAEFILQLPAGKDPAFQLFSRIYGVDPEELRKNCLKFITPPKGEDKMRYFTNQMIEISKKIEELVAVSNTLSASRLSELILQTRKPHSLYQVGGLHSGFIEDLYDGRE